MADAPINNNQVDEIMSPKPDSRRVRTQRIIEDPEFLETICGHVANGGTVITLAKTWDIRYSDIMNWVAADKERLRRYKASLDARGEWAIERLLHELNTLGFSDVRQVLNDDGTMKPPSEWPDESAGAVAGVEVRESFNQDGDVSSVTKKLKLWDKNHAVRLIAQISKLLIDRVEHTGKLTLEDLLTNVKELKDAKQNAAKVGGGDVKQISSGHETKKNDENNHT